MNKTSTLGLAYLVGASCLLLVASCGDGRTGGDDAEMTVEQYADGYRTLFYRSLCRASTECPDQQRPRLTRRVSRYASLDDCQRGLANNGIVDIRVPYVSEVQHGVVSFNGESAQSCLDELDQRVAQSPCDSFRAIAPQPAVCGRVLEGQQQEGMPCSSDDHCISGACDTTVDLEADVCWRGECIPEPEMQTVGAGESCESPGRTCDAEAGLVCAPSTTEADDVCVKPSDRVEGERCNGFVGYCADGLACVGGECTRLEFASEGQECTLNETLCESGLVCTIQALEDGRAASAECHPPGDIGETCFRHEECVGGTRCSSRTVVGYEEGTCEPAAGRGDACADALECDLGLYCNVDTCRDGPRFTSTCDYGG